MWPHVLAGLVLVALNLWWNTKRSRRYLEAWARRSGVQLVAVERRYFRRGLFWLRRDGGYEVFRVKVPGPRGCTRSGFVRVGGWFAGLFSAKADVEWEDWARRSALGWSRRPPTRAGGGRPMKARTFGWGGVVVALGLGIAQAEEPAPVAPAAARVPWSDADARVAKDDAPLYLQVFVGADGRVALRSTTPGPKPAWTEHGLWRLDAEPKAQMEALRGLSAALLRIHSDSAVPGLRSPNESSAARLLIDAEAATPWRHVQWVVTTAALSNVRVYRLSFSVLEPGGWIDNQLPRDGSSSAPVSFELEATELEVKLFRKDVEKAKEAHYTRLRITSRPTSLSGALEEVPEEEGPPPPRPETSVTVDLPGVHAASGQHAAAWRRVEAHLRKFGGTGLPLSGVIKTPTPTGQLVPYADVVALLPLFQALGCTRVGFEGAPPPLVTKDGGGWQFDRR